MFNLAPQQDIKRLGVKAGIALLFACVLFVHQFIYPFIPKLTSEHGQLIWSVIAILSAWVIFHCGSTIFRTAWQAFRANETNKNTLIALGTFILLVYSVLRVAFPHRMGVLLVENYFADAAAIIGLANIGLIFETLSHRTNLFLLEHLDSLLPKTITEILPDNTERVIRLDQVTPGMILKAEPGDMIAADGTIVSGSGKIDNSPFNRDPIPKTVREDMAVLAGAINKTHPITYEVSYAGEHTALGHTRELLLSALNSKSSGQRFMEVFTTIYIPVVLLLATGSMLGWYLFGPEPHYVHAMLCTVTMLVGVSPTAFALSYPIASLMGMSKATEYGILFQNNSSLLKTAKVNTLIFDKSGILTEAKPQLIKIHTAKNWETNRAIQLAASVEARYEQALANAITQAAAERNLAILDTSDFQVHDKLGLSAMVKQEQVLIGNAKFMRQKNVDMSQIEQIVQRTSQKGNTILIVAVQNQAIALLVLRDPIKKDARDAIKRIKNMGINTIMFTGDHRISGEALARHLGIHSVFANINSEGKVAEIRKRQHMGEVVALIAESTSNTEAFAQADLAIALGNEQHLLLGAAEINLLRGSLHTVADTLAIARATFQKIRQNLLVSVIYNTVILMLTAGIAYPIVKTTLSPIMAILLTTLTTLFVIFNAQRLRHYHPIQSKR